MALTMVMMRPNVWLNYRTTLSLFARLRTLIRVAVLPSMIHVYLGVSEVAVI